MAKRWDIFCAVVDNYGDIGVTWRLARQLVAEYGLSVRLWVDELEAFQRICPQVQGAAPWQIQGVQVLHWAGDFAHVEPADVVIEAFACSLPAAYIESMAANAGKSLWLNLEYLSAEDWVAGCHGLPSPQGAGLSKFFFFPGFSEGTGGLLREAPLLGQHQALQHNPREKQAFLRRLGVEVSPQSRLISLFAYENQGLGPWLAALSQGAQSTHVLVPQGRIEADVQAFIGQPLEVGQVVERGALRVHSMAFLSQEDYDRLLACCDFNAVRGEDSFVRAQWAGKPLLWHIYQQAEDAHWDKLEAFLALYCAELEPDQAKALQGLWRAWNGRGEMVSAWRDYEKHWLQLEKHAQNWALAQAARPDLAATLVQFHLNWLSCAA